MNNFFIMTMLFTASSIIAMELSKEISLHSDKLASAMTITEKESKDFLRHLAMATGFGNKMVAQGELSKNNPIQCMVHKMEQDLRESDGDIYKMITIQGLSNRLDMYKKVDSDATIQFALSQIRTGGGDIKEAESYIIKTRRILSGLELKRLQPTYSGAWIGELQTNNRIAFMKRNENYPLDEDAIKDYIAMFIYQTLLSLQIP